ncbi:NADH dehydrogenase [ubiquinone] 1 alpha subcomplex assembly factor 4-like [Mytilus galloprovincialis]|uniref:NADH dehydrogenase [ubiquinone] 1 alpha subcomplex assembly factor 4-like n=1 Tax=Mytilus galloprovincialis TaxID=29158 RepID=UPI003F7C8C69
MGNRISELLPTVSRSFKNYNIENRSHRFIQKDKLPAAPRHDSTADILDKFSKEHPELYEAQKVKDNVLDERLKTLQIDSTGKNQDIVAKKMPESRKETEDPEFGFDEPASIPEGKVTLRKTLEFILNHQKYPEEYTSEQVAKEYKLDPVQVKHVLKHFQTFELHVSNEFKKRNEKAVKYLSSQRQEPTVYKLAESTDLSKDQKTANK